MILCKQAKDSGAVGALVSRWISEVDLPQLRTSDSLISLQDIARNHRKLFTGEVVGITGSCGKTSTKEILSILLGKNDTLSTRGNLNNHLGVPLTLLEIDPEIHRYAVVEAGINQPGEMDQLANMISPDYAVVTLVVGQSHLEGLGSVEKVADEKSKIFNISGNNSKIMFPESCQIFSIQRKKKFRMTENHIVLKVVSHLIPKLVKVKPILIFGLKQKQTGARRRYGFGVTSPHFFQ